MRSGSMKECKTCDGDGAIYDEYGQAETCPDCGGEGGIPMTSREIRDEHEDYLYDQYVDRQLEREAERRNRSDG